MELNTHKKTPSFIIIIFLAFATLAVYWQIQDHEFVSLDDNFQIYENSNVQMGLTIEGIVWAFTATDNGHWMPLTWLSYMMDFSIYGLNPGVYHLTNLLLHIANVVLLFLVLKGMTGTIWRSAFVSALFALHPLHVESVAWVSARRDVLSTFFWILTMGAYVRYVKRPGTGRYFIIFLFLVLGLMSKAMLVTLPFVLLLLDYWPLGRMVSTDHGLRHNIVRLIREKAPFFVLVATSSVVTIFAGHIAKSMELFTLKERIANALFSYVSYIGKMVWPQHLTVFYPFNSSIPVWNYTGAGLLMVCISALVFWRARRNSYLLVGWLWYLGTLVPVIGFVQANKFSMADRYTYVPLIGLFIIIAWGVPDILAKLRYQRIVLSVSGGIVILTLMTLTWFQVRCWHNSITLFEHAINVTTKNYLAHNNLGFVLAGEGRPEEAISHYKEALQIKPNYGMAHNNLGISLVKEERTEEAISHYKEALRIHPNFAGAHNNYGNALSRQGKYDEAISHFKKALQIKPNHDKAHNNYGNTLLRQGKHDEAITHYKKAVQINPDNHKAHNNLGVNLARKGMLVESIFHFKKALQINSGSVEIRGNLQRVLMDIDKAKGHYNEGIALNSQGQIDDAITKYRKALRINPGYAEVHNDMGIALARSKKPGEAFVHFNKAVQIKPDYAQAHFNIGITLTGQNKLSEAIEHFSEAIIINPNYVEAYVSLGVAFLNQGEHDEALINFSKALQINPNYAKAHNNLGLALAQKGDLNEAIKHFSEALRINPDFKEARTNLELALKNLNKSDKALEHW